MVKDRKISHVQLRNDFFFMSYELLCSSDIPARLNFPLLLRRYDSHHNLKTSTPISPLTLTTTQTECLHRANVNLTPDLTLIRNPEEFMCPC